MYVVLFSCIFLVWPSLAVKANSHTGKVHRWYSLRLGERQGHHRRCMHHCTGKTVGISSGDGAEERTYSASALDSCPKGGRSDPFVISALSGREVYCQLINTIICIRARAHLLFPSIRDSFKISRMLDCPSSIRLTRSDRSEPVSATLSSKTRVPPPQEK